MSLCTQACTFLTFSFNIKEPHFHSLLIYWTDNSTSRVSCPSKPWKCSNSQSPNIVCAKKRTWLLLVKTPDAPNYSSHMATKYLHSARLWLWYVDVTDIRILSTCVPRIQRAWRASTSRRGSWQGQDKNLTSHRRGETVASESLQDPVMTTNISPVRPHEENQTDNHMVQRENERHL